MVCYYYPPLADVGTRRCVSFARYLRELGWDPHVVSVRNPDKFYCVPGAVEPPEEVPVSYTRSVFGLYRILGSFNGFLSRLARLAGFHINRNYLYDLFCMPDGFIGWIPFTIFECLRIVNRKRIDCVFVSCKPFSAAIIGLVVKRVKKVPLILDFRDPYSLDVVEISEKSKRPHWRKRIDRWIETSLFRQSDAVINVSKEITKTYQRIYPRIADQLFTIYNGFDERHLPASEPVEKYEPFTVVYAGNLYYLQESEPFFEALAQMKREGSIRAGRFQFLYFGESGRRVMQEARRHGIEDLVVTHARVPYKRMLGVLLCSHLLYIRVTQYAVPSKIHDGLALGVPFLGWIPYTEAKEIIHQYSSESYVFEENTPENYIDAIKRALNKKDSNDSNSDFKRKQFLDSFSRRNNAIQLSEILNKLI